MPTLYESYASGGDAAYTVWGSRWRAQTFTPTIEHTITSVKLLLARVGSPGTMTVSIRATDANGEPTGADLVSGTSDGDTLPLVSGTNWGAFEWREITFGAGILLSANTKYAIVLRFTSGDADANYGRWQHDSSSPTYAGGNVSLSSDSGATWEEILTSDFLFEDWGDPIAFIPKVFIL